jgi:hypothetical protein
MGYWCAGLCTDFESRPKKCKITAKIGKNLKKAIKLYHMHGPIFENLIQNSKILLSVSPPYIRNTDIKNKKKFSKKIIAGSFTTVQRGIENKTEQQNKYRNSIIVTNFHLFYKNNAFRMTLLLSCNLCLPSRLT